MIKDILHKIDLGLQPSTEELQCLLEVNDPTILSALFSCAYKIKTQEVGTSVYLRALIEWNNICAKDCYYCGIRKSNRKIRHFQMSEEDVIQLAIDAYRYGYTSITLQSGERQSDGFTASVERMLKQIHRHTDKKLRITLSLGEQNEDTYRRWLHAGAHRYLLRIETTNPQLYASLHPHDHHFNIRKHCLALLKKVGYQVGTGIMIGLPGQTTQDLINDLLFMHDIDVDMVGMGPYIPHPDTPLGEKVASYNALQKQQALMAGLKMIALTRIYLRDINIVAATSLQALADNGREQGLLAGANVLMPNYTLDAYRADYCLYENKPKQDEHSISQQAHLYKKIHAIGEQIKMDDWGDPKHYLIRTQ